LWGLAGLAALTVAAPAAAQDHLVGVVSESGDFVSWFRPDGRGGLLLDREVPVGLLLAGIDGPHHLAVMPDQRSYLISIAHGVPAGTLWRLDARSDTLLGRAPLENFPTTIAVTPDGEFAFVANSDFHGDRPRINPVTVVHVPTMTAMAHVPACDMPHGVKVNPAGTRVYISCMHSDEILEMHAASFEILRRQRIGAGHQMAAGHGGHGAHAGHGTPPAAGTVLPAPPALAGRACAPTYVSLSADGRQLYVACNAASTLQVWETDGFRLLAEIEVGAGAYNAAPAPDGRLVVVTNKRDQSISLVDLATRREAARIRTAKPIVHGIAFSPDGRTAYISAESIGSDPGSVDVLDLATRRITGTVPVRAQPTGIAVLKLKP
jgi:DNA-binding beta-propeller fold protein YncE